MAINCAKFEKLLQSKSFSKELTYAGRRASLGLPNRISIQSFSLNNPMTNRLSPCQQRFLSPCNWQAWQKEKETLSLFLLLAQLITRKKRPLPASSERGFSCAVSFGCENKGIITQDNLIRYFKNTPISWKENLNFNLKGKLSQARFRFLLQICSLLDCSQQITGKIIGGHRACFLTNCRERWTWF